MLCPTCGTGNNETARFCVRCGTRVRAVDETEARPAQATDSWRGYYSRGCLGIGSMLVAVAIAVMAVTTFGNYPVANLFWLGVAVIFFLLGRKYWPKR